VAVPLTCTFVEIGLDTLHEFNPANSTNPVKIINIDFLTLLPYFGQK
jgi:hypothetical protein